MLYVFMGFERVTAAHNPVCTDGGTSMVLNTPSDWTAFEPMYFAFEAIVLTLLD